MDCLKIFSSNVNTCRDAKTRAGILDYLDRYRPDIWLLQEVNVQTDELQSLVENKGYKANCNVDLDDENSWGTAFIWKNQINLTNIIIFEDCRIQFAQVGRLNLLNIYAPSGQENRTARREFFGQTLFQHYRSLAPNLPLCGGDFNSILYNIDARNNPNQKKSEDLRNLVHGFNLFDTFRHFYPHQVEFTFHRAESASRLDRFYAPQFMMPFTHSAQHLPQPYSDHCTVEITLHVPDLQKIKIESPNRFSYWKFNTENLDMDFEENFSVVFEKARESIGQFNDIADWWDLKLKPMMIIFCKHYSIAKSRERKCTKDFLYCQLTHAMRNGSTSEIQRLKSELNRILIFEANGIKVRSRYKESLENERSSLFHMNREIKKGKENNVENLLIGPVGFQKLETDPKKCKDEIMTFFSALFSGRLGLNGEILENPFEMDEANLPEFLNDSVAKLSDIDRDILERPFSMEVKTVSKIFLIINPQVGMESPMKCLRKFSTLSK